jgi:hypothetical protein
MKSIFLSGCALAMALSAVSPALADYNECGSYSAPSDGSMDFVYCWMAPSDSNTDYNYDVWQRLVDTPCWTHTQGFAQGGTGPEYWNLNSEGGPPSPECP